MAGDTLIVGKLENYEWVSGIYQRKAGLGYHNTDEEIYNARTINHRKGDPIQRYFHDVPLKGREFYEQFKTDCNGNIVLDATTGEKIVETTLSFNYDENHWQFKHLDSTSGVTKDTKFAVTSRTSCASCAKVCVEDVKRWHYTYKSIDSTSIPSVTHYNIGMKLIESGPSKFQIRDTAALSTSDYTAITTSVNAFKCPPAPVTPAPAPSSSSSTSTTSNSVSG